MATVYFDLPNAVNGTGTSASPKNATGWAAQTKTAGDIYLFKRGTTSAAASFVLTAGTAGNVIKWGAWYNADGTDDSTQAKPILVTTTTLSTYGSPKDYTWLDNLEIHSSSIAAANDLSLIFLGTGSKVSECTIDSTIGCIGIWGKSNVTVTDTLMYGVSHSSANNNVVLIVSDTPAMDAITITGNVIYHYGGGGTSSHAVRLECTHATNTLTNLLFQNNTVNTSTELPCANKSAIGVRVSKAPSAQIDYNTIKNFLEGIFFLGGGSAQMCWIRYNTCNNNYHYGIHLSTDAVGCYLDTNICSYNGTSTHDGSILFAYGRGIECTSAAGQGKCANHTIRFNTCNNNYNYGGPNDNGSEGVGIGLDDGTSGCLVYGNTCRNNEGNGIQYYGGTGTDTGNNCIANLLDTNCTASYTNRRTGGTYTNLFNAHIGMAGILGTTSYVAHNVFTGVTKVGIATNVSCDDLIIANNIFYNTAYCISMNHSATAGVCTNNDYFGSTQKYTTNSTDANGSNTYVVHPTYVGTNELTFDPVVNANYIPSNTSPAISAGANIGTRLDYLGRTYYPNPTVGWSEIFDATPPTNKASVGGRTRRFINHRH